VLLSAALCAISPASLAKGGRATRDRPQQAAAAADANYSLTTSTCPICTTAQIERWQFVSANQAGIAGRDPVGWWISVFRADASSADWVPQGVGKQTLCGTLADFGFYDGGGDEADWNSYIYPSQPFRFILDDVARRYGVTSEWHRRTVLIGDQASKQLIVEGEITPDEGFYENPWFNRAPRARRSKEMSCAPMDRGSLTPATTCGPRSILPSCTGGAQSRLHAC